MKRLFLRELRRQLVPAAGLLLLAWLLVPVMGLGVSLGVLRAADPSISLLLLTCVTPWLLGVSAFAPDLEQGGEGFLARLPVSRLRVFSLRVVVAAGLSLLTIAAGQLGFGLVDPALASASVHGLYPKPVNALLLFLIPLVGGVLSGLALRRGLLAFALTPVVVGAPIALLRASETYWGAPGFVSRVGLFALIGLSLICAAWIQRADLARSEVRGPLRRVALTFVPMILLYGVGVGAVRKLDFAFAHETDHAMHYLPAFRGPGPRRLAVVRRYPRTQLRWGRAEEEVGREYVLDARSSTRWLLPLGHTGVSISPDERWLLCFDHASREFSRWSIAERRVVETWRTPAGVEADTLLWNVGQRALGYERTLWTWVDEVPCCLRDGGLFPRGGGEPLVRGAVLDARGGQALLLVGEGAIERVDLRSGAQTPIALAGTRWEDARLSPDGSSLFAVGTRDGAPLLAIGGPGQPLRQLEDLPSGLVRSWQQEGRRRRAVRVGFEPGGRWVSVSMDWSPGLGPEWFHELRVISLGEDPREHRLQGKPADWLDWSGHQAWSPDGRFLVGQRGVLDLRTGSAREGLSHNAPALLWLDDRRMFLGANDVLDLEDLSVGPPPSWLR